jgi:tetratricopeptide (TPR) repeat protein
MDEAFPLAVPDDGAGHDRVRAALEKTAAHYERTGNSGQIGETFRAAVARYPDGSAGRGRCLLRDGYARAAAECLATATAADPDDGEAWHLLGAARLETGHPRAARDAFVQAVRAGRPYPAARYFLALGLVAEGATGDALSELERLLAAAPDHAEGRRLRAWLLAEADPVRADAEAAALEAEAPADPRVLALRERTARAAGEDATAEACAAALAEVLAAEPGAGARLAEFRAAAAGRYVHPKRLE